MLRDEVLKRLVALPADVDVVIRLGGAHIDIAGVVQLAGERNAALLPHLPDVRDVFIEHGVLAPRLLDDSE